MSNAVVIDTHQFVENLTRKGFTKQQAEALVTEYVPLIISSVVTNEHLDKRLAELKVELIKALAETKAETTKALAETKAEITKALAETKAEIIKWVSGLMIAQGGLIVALIKLL